MKNKRPSLENQDFLNPRSFCQCDALWQVVAMDTIHLTYFYLLGRRVREHTFWHGSYRQTDYKMIWHQEEGCKAIRAFRWQPGHPTWQGTSELQHLTFNFPYITLHIYWDLKLPPGGLTAIHRSCSSYYAVWNIAHILTDIYWPHHLSLLWIQILHLCCFHFEHGMSNSFQELNPTSEIQQPVKTNKK